MIFKESEEQKGKYEKEKKGIYEQAIKGKSPKLMTLSACKLYRCVLQFCMLLHTFIE